MYFNVVKKIIKKVIFLVIISLSLAHSLFSDEVTVGNTKVIFPAGLDPQATAIATEIQAISDNIGPGMSNASHLANLGGYAIGDAYIGKFPKFYVGVSVTGGLANLSYFDPTFVKPQGYLPAASPNPVLFGGLGFGKGLDLQFKAMAFSSGFLPDALINGLIPISFVQLDKFNIYSAGAKVRYNLVKRKKIFPGLFEVGGVTVSAGADFAYGEINVSGIYSYPVTPATYTPSYTLAVSWLMISASVQAVVYLDFLWIFNLYFGIGATLNFGSFDMNLEGSGPVVGLPGPPTVSFESVNKYYVSIFVPTFVIGLELDFWKVKIALESMVNLLNREDISLQLAFRVKI